MTVRFLFIDDAFGEGGDAEHYRRLLDQPDLLRVELRRPSREAFLVAENELEPNIDGFILDINLKDIAHEGVRFVGTGAGLAQDLRLLQTAGGDDGQRPRPIVRLCADQVFQRYLAGADSTEDVFDLGFSKETVADVAGEARQQIACLPNLYDGIADAAADGMVANLLGVSGERYDDLHSAFRSSLELELTRKPHETANFLIRFFLQPPGLLISEELLAVRLGVDIMRSAGWSTVRALFADAVYSGRGAQGFARWWNAGVQRSWAEISPIPLFKLSVDERVGVLRERGCEQIQPLESDPRSPGDRPWNIAHSEDPQLRLPSDPRFSYEIISAGKPWLDSVYWSLEQAKRQRNSVQMSLATKERLKADLTRKANARAK